MTFRPAYLASAVALLLVEIAIARGYLPGTFVRNSLGDLLVIPLLYCFLRALTHVPPTLALLITLALGFITELLQYLHLADRLGLQPASLPYILLGNTFSATDLLMYSLGALLTTWLDPSVRQPHYPLPAQLP